VKKAGLLADMHLRSLRQKMTLLQLTEESAKKLEVLIHIIAVLVHLWRLGGSVVIG